MTTRKNITNLTNITKKVKQKTWWQTCRPRGKYLLSGKTRSLGRIYLFGNQYLNGQANAQSKICAHPKGCFESTS